MERIVVDLSTGEQRIVPLTEDEIAEIESRPEPPASPKPLTTAERLEAAGFNKVLLKPIRSQELMQALNI